MLKKKHIVHVNVAGFKTESKGQFDVQFDKHHDCTLIYMLRYL